MSSYVEGSKQLLSDGITQLRSLMHHYYGIGSDPHNTNSPTSSSSDQDGGGVEHDHRHDGTEDNGSSSSSATSATSAAKQLFSFACSHPYLTMYVTSLLVSQVAKLAAKIYWKNTILELDLSLLVLSEKPVSPLMQLTNPNMVWYWDVIEALKLAENDEKIIGLLVRYGGAAQGGTQALERLGLGQLDELRSAIVSFGQKKGNNTTVAHGSSIGVPTSDISGKSVKSTSEYYLISACQKVYLTPSGLVLLPGFLLNQPFVKHTLQKLNVEFQGFKREEYKTSLNMFTEDKLDEHHRQQLESLVTSIKEVMVGAMAQSRNVTEQQVESWFERAFIDANEAKESKIVDELKFRDQVYDEMSQMTKSSVSGSGSGGSHQKPNYLFLTAYLEKKQRMYQRGRKQVALVFAEGAIVAGEDKPSMFDLGESRMIHAETFSARLRQIRKDKKIEAVILRINSPGGDAIASDIISREVDLLREAGKKVVVSMGSVAASGGYWIAAKADKIVCNPLAVTGSIGVLFGKINARQFWSEKLGVTFDGTQGNKNADLLSSVHSLNEEQRGIIDHSIDLIYEQFKQRVAEGRGMDVDRVSQIAKGQVYMGSDALKLGLVDEVGGLMEAIQVTEKLIDAEQRGIKLVLFPKKQSVSQQLLKGLTKADNSEKREQKLVASASAFTSVISTVHQFFGLSKVVQQVSQLTGVSNVILGQQHVAMMTSLSMLSQSKVMAYDPTLSML